MSHGGESRRIAMGVEYDGSSYAGWQTQTHAPSVQDTLQAAISAVADETTGCTGAGRTDSGVHATNQVLHFDTTARRSDRQWRLGVNSNLPEDVNISWVRHVSEDFHARYSAVSRSYRYLILNRPVRTSLHRARAWWLHADLDLESMKQAASSLIGEHDFSAFRAAGCQARSPRRNIHRLDIWQQGQLIVVECQANAFLHHMVRNIVGSLVRIGQGEARVDWLSELLESKDRRLAGITAPAHGLYLIQVDYPSQFGVPTESVVGGVICV